MKVIVLLAVIMIVFFFLKILRNAEMFVIKSEDFLSEINGWAMSYPWFNEICVESGINNIKIKKGKKTIKEVMAYKLKLQIAYADFKKTFFKKTHVNIDDLNIPYTPVFTIIQKKENKDSTTS